jgi:hypothetical protein
MLREGIESPHQGATKQPGCELSMRLLVEGGLGSSHNEAMQQYDVWQYSSYSPGEAHSRENRAPTKSPARGRADRKYQHKLQWEQLKQK